MTLSLILAYAALLFLVALALVYSHWPHWLKALLVGAVTLLYFYGHDTAHGLVGTPSTDALPERFVMLSAVVDEPTKKSAGAVYLWVSPLSDEKVEGKGLIAPRAYKLPYHRKLHEQIVEGVKKGKDGVSQMGTAEIKAGAGRGLSWLSPGNDEQEVKISDLPVPQMPEK
jgi:hypothetical protein